MQRKLQPTKQHKWLLETTINCRIYAQKWNNVHRSVGHAQKIAIFGELLTVS